jgi:hypothetical protein
MSPETWLKNAVADAERRGLPELKPMLEGLAQATAVLRAADINDLADGTSHQPPGTSHRPRG